MNEVKNHTTGNAVWVSSSEGWEDETSSFNLSTLPFNSSMYLDASIMIDALFT